MAEHGQLCFEAAAIDVIKGGEAERGRAVASEDEKSAIVRMQRFQTV
jgi:hypothetical protein